MNQNLSGNFGARKSGYQFQKQSILSSVCIIKTAPPETVLSRSSSSFFQAQLFQKGVMKKVCSENSRKLTREPTYLIEFLDVFRTESKM